MNNWPTGPPDEVHLSVLLALVMSYGMLSTFSMDHESLTYPINPKEVTVSFDSQTDDRTPYDYPYLL